MTLGEVVTNLDRLRRPVSKSARSTGIYPYYGANGVQDYVDDFIFDGTYLLMGEDGSVARADGTPILNWAIGKIWVNNHAHVLAERSGGINLRFLYHYLHTVDIRPIVTGSAQPKLNQGNMNGIAVPVPDRGEQERFVRILDTFGALVNDLTVGLSAELAARQTEYGYYRDRLLSFEEAA